MYEEVNNIIFMFIYRLKAKYMHVKSNKVILMHVLGLLAEYMHGKVFLI